jgi:hypothetical protein
VYKTGFASLAGGYDHRPWRRDACTGFPGAVGAGLARGPGCLAFSVDPGRLLVIVRLLGVQDASGAVYELSSLSLAVHSLASKGWAGLGR